MAVPADPYRVLFERLSAGAAHCRLTIERDRVVAVEVLDRNPAFDAVHHAVPRLYELLAMNLFGISSHAGHGR